MRNSIICFPRPRLFIRHSGEGRNLSDFEASSPHQSDQLFGFGEIAAHQPVEEAPGFGAQNTLGGLRDLIFEDARSEEHTSELQSLMRISYAVFCFKKKTQFLASY